MCHINRIWTYALAFLLLTLVAVLGDGTSLLRYRLWSAPVAAQPGDPGEHTTWERLSTEALAKISPVVWEDAIDGPADFLVILTEQADLSAAEALPTKAAKGHFTYNVLQALAQRTQAPLRAMLDARGVPYRSFYIVNVLQVTGGQDVVLALAQRPDVARIAANPHIQMRLLQPSATSMSHKNGGPALPATLRLDVGQRSPDRAPVGIEWNVSKIGAPQVWALGYTGQDVVVAGQDTGYDWDHPALKSQYRGWDGTTVDHNYHWHDAVHSGGGVCGSDAPAPCDDYGHGTHTLGTMVGDDGARKQIGVAPGAQWIGCRNMDRGVGTPATYIECFEFFLAPYALGSTAANGRPDMAPDIIGNSWSCPPSEGCDWDTLLATVEAVRAAGIMVVAAAGNSGPSCSTVRDPIGLYDAVYTIGATNSSDGIASFSGRGPVTIDGSGRLKPDIVAPGVNVLSSRPGGSYGFSSGTSMATPHVVGAAALLWSARPELRGYISQTERLLNGTTLPLYSTQCGDEAGRSPNNVYGWGRLDALAAVQHAIGGWLQGQVTSEQPLEDVVIQAQLTDALSWETISEQDGAYTLSLVAGTYTVTASATGYIPYLTTGITVAYGHTTTLDIPLEPCELVQGVSITFTPTMPHPNDLITFTASVTAGTPPVTYKWRLASGIYASGPTVTATYGARGVYPVTLTVTNCGGSITVTQWVTVVAPEITVTGPKLQALLVKGETTSRVLTVTNVGNAPLSWGFIVTPTVDWFDLQLLGSALSLQTHVGNLPSASEAVASSVVMPLAPQQSAILSATFDTSGFSPGGYTSTLVITSTDTAHPYIGLPVILGVDCEPVDDLHMHRVPAGDLWARGKVTFTAEALTGTPPITYTWRFGDGGYASGDSVVYTYPLTMRTRVYSLSLEATNLCRIPQRVVYPITVKARTLYLPCVMRMG